MSGEKKQKLPIGYWLKRADNLLTTRINKAQFSNGLNRLDWQILNVIQKAGITSREEIAVTLRPFAEASGVNEALDRLAGRNLVSGSEAQYELTKLGADTYKRALALQKNIRQLAVKGISKADYATTVKVLQRLVNYLEHRKEEL